MPELINALRLIPLVLLFGACQRENFEQKLAVQVVNKSQQPITYGRLSTATGQGNVDFTVAVAETRDLQFGFGRVAKTDGAYRLTCKFSGSANTLTKQFGYYTNGSPVDKSLLLTVYADSIAVKSVLRDY